MNPNKIPDLHWNLVDTYHTTNIGQIDPQATWVSTHCIYVVTLSYAEGGRYGEWCGMTLNTNMTILQNNREPIVCPVINNSENQI